MNPKNMNMYPSNTLKIPGKVLKFIQNICLKKYNTRQKK